MFVDNVVNRGRMAYEQMVKIFGVGDARKEREVVEGAGNGWKA